jgi:hypothetical protein
MTDQDIETLMKSLPAARRRELLMVTLFEERTILGIASAMLDLLSKMALLHDPQVRCKLVEMARDTADAIEAPMLNH